jgi:hypothetical protein
MPLKLGLPIRIYSTITGPARGHHHSAGLPNIDVHICLAGTIKWYLNGVRRGTSSSQKKSCPEIDERKK